MRYLLDTCIFIFSVSDKDKLTKETCHILEDDRSLVYVSSNTVEEVIHLIQGEKIRVKQWKSAKDVIGFIKDETDFGIKYIAEEHLGTLAGLYRYKDHKDPFDRMIIAHALTEGLTLISTDREFPRYKKFGLELVFNPL